MSEHWIWIPFYVGDYLRDTLHLSDRQHGAYLLILFHYYCHHRPPPDNDEVLARIARSSLSDWPAIRSAIAEFFDVRDGHWYHDRVEQVLADMHRVRKAKQDGAFKTNAKRWGGAKRGTEGVAQRVAKRSLRTYP